MTNPYENQPLAQADPGHSQQPVPPGPRQPVPPGPRQPAPPGSQQLWPPQQPAYMPPQDVLPQHLPPQSQWQASPPAAKQSNGLAITALVVASLALLISLGLSAVAAVSAFSPSAMGTATDTAPLQGTAPQVVSGETYSGVLLQEEVSRVISGDSGDVESMKCPTTTVVNTGVVTVCHGVVDSIDSKARVTFQDRLGHFTLVEE